MMYRSDTMEQDNELLMDMVLDTLVKIQNLGLPAKLNELTFITISEYMKKYSPEIFDNTYMPYVEQIIDQIYEQNQVDITENEENGN